MIWKAKEEGAGSVALIISPPGNPYVVNNVSYDIGTPRVLNGDFSNAAAGYFVQGDDLQAASVIEAVLSGGTQVHISKDVTQTNNAASITVLPTGGLTGGMLRRIDVDVLVAGLLTNNMQVSISPGADAAFPSKSWLRPLAPGESNGFSLEFADPIQWSTGTISVVASCQTAGQDLAAPASLNLLVGYENA